MKSAALIASNAALLALSCNAELSIWQFLGAVLVGLVLVAIFYWFIEGW